MAKREIRLTLLVMLLLLMLLGGITPGASIGADLIGPMLLVGLVVIFSLSFGVTWPGGSMSTLPVMSAVAFLVLGLAPAAWVIAAGSLLHGIVRYRFRRELHIAEMLSWGEVASRTAVNAGNNTLSMIVGGWTFLLITGSAQVEPLTPTWIIALTCFAITYFLINYGLISLYYRYFAPAQLGAFVRQIPSLLLYEAAPFVFVPLFSGVYDSLGLGYFALLCFVVIGFSIITQSLGRTRQGLERRLHELDGLQLMGQAMGASLELDKLLQEIYGQVRRLMPADTFYVALYDRDADQISFPFFIQEGVKTYFPSRRPKNGLTEYILRSRQSLLLPNNLRANLAALDLEPIGVMAASTLSVPILAGEQALGIVSVQSLEHENVYTQSHQKLLETVATQAALAIQNARLYTQIRSSLSQRVQELNSIFRATQDGILLLGRDGKMLAVNRAFGRFVGLIGLEPRGQLVAKWPTEGGTLLARLGFADGEFRLVCQGLLQEQEGAQVKKQIPVPGSVDRFAERVVTAVYDNIHEQVMGWLIILRDVTEEVELARLREEMIHMLVHDLRSPLAIILSTLELGRMQVTNGQADHMVSVLTMAEKNGQRMMRLINDLLNIYKLENQTVPLETRWVPPVLLLQDTAAQFAEAAEQANLSLSVNAPEGLPPLLVDYEYVARLLFNLADNAIKFTPDGGHISLWAQLDQSQIPQTMLLGVSDTGPGIPPSIQESLFEKFRIGHAVGRRSGTGLGLPYCKLVAEAHGGEIWVESTGVPGEGSTFLVRLPVVSSEQLAILTGSAS